MSAPLPSTPRTIELGADGRLHVSDDPDGVLAGFVGTILHGEWRADIERLFAPDGDGVWVDTLGGATRVLDREQLQPPHDEDLSIDPERDEIWLVERERKRQPATRVIVTGDELRKLLSRGMVLLAPRGH
jgi:hypothetical protein